MQSIGVQASSAPRQGNEMRDTDERLTALKAARAASGLTLDFWADITEGLSQACLESVCRNAHIFLKYANPTAERTYRAFAIL